MSESIFLNTTYPPETTSNTVTSFLPFTTSFPFVGCTPLISMQLLTQLALNFYTLPRNQECLPEAGVPLRPATTSVGGVATVFNTGPVNCLRPYVTGATSIIRDSTTLVACCPSDYTFSHFTPATLLTTTIVPSTFEGICTSALSSGDVIVYSQYKSSFASTTQTDSGALPASFVSTTIKIPTSIVAVAFHGTNIAVEETTTPVSQSSQTPPIAVSSATATAAPTSSSTSIASHRLSSNSLVGITLGGAFGLFFIFSLVGLLILRRRRAVLAERAGRQTRERSGDWKQELSCPDQKFEMDGGGKRFELVSERHLAHEMAVLEKPLELAG